MSCNNWEQVTLTFSSAEFPKFRKTLLAVANERKTSRFALATRLFDRLLAQGKGKRGYKFFAVCTSGVTYSYADDTIRADSERFWADVKDETERYLLAKLLYPKRETGEKEWNGQPRMAQNYAPTDKPRRPKKSALVLIKQNATALSCGECAIEFDPKARLVTYGSGENNHQVERARDSWLGKAFFAAADRVCWVRNTGGTGTGNDEYHRDDHSEGGGGNYTTVRYGPKGGRPVGKSEEQIRREESRTSYYGVGSVRGRFW